MEQAVIAPDALRDPFERNVPGLGLGRDGCRTPMQWDDSRNAGFSKARPWLPILESLRRVNVAAQQREDNSFLDLYRKLIAFRRSRATLVSGSYRPIAASGAMLAYLREQDDDRLLVALNLGSEPLSMVLSVPELRGCILISTLGDRSKEPIESEIDLRPNEGVVIELARSTGSQERCVIRRSGTRD
jgi:alpha-glucosidase